jgi:DNA invertase Pin-like site-specific DNA recombinase
LCDRLSRREFLQAGALSVGGLTLADLLRLRAQTPTRAITTSKAIIMVYLNGGPSHIDLYDLKPAAPVEYRGEFKPIRTNVPGMDICELLPLQAKIADRFAIVRNMKFKQQGHTPPELYTGFLDGKRPSIGSVVSKLRSDAGIVGAMPPHVALGDANHIGGPGFLGTAHRPYLPGERAAANLGRAEGVSLDRLADRKALLRTFDGLRRDLDDSRGSLAGLDAFNRQALEMLTTNRARDAFDVSKEPAPVQAKYGKGIEFLQARRLVEAGVPVVTLTPRNRNPGPPQQKKKGRSADRQDGGAEKWAQTHGFRLAAERQYRDEGLSRYNGEARMKGALSRFLALCGTSAVPPGSILIIEDFDRLSRENADDAWELFRQILLAGVEIVVLSLDRWFKKESLHRFEDRLLVQACQHRAHQESKMKADRQRDIWADRRRRAQHGKGVYTRLPSWIRRCPDGTLELIPERVETIREAVRLVLAGLGTRRIARRFTIGPDVRPCWLDRGEWDSESLQQILRRPAIWGAYQPTRMDEKRRLVPIGELVRGHYPAVLSEEEAEEVRRTLRNRRNNRGRPAKRDRSILGRLVRDAETGQFLRLKSSGNGPRRDYLDRRWQGRSQLVAPYPVIEGLVLRAVEEWTPDALSPRDRRSEQQCVSNLLADLGTIAEDRKAIQEQLARPGRAATTAAILAEQLDALDVREAEVKELLAEAQSVVGGVSAVALRDCQSLAKKWAGLTDAERPEASCRLNARLREVLDGVWIYRRRLTARTAELIVQIWPRAGDVKERRIFLGKPTADFRPLDTGGADLRQGYPDALPARRAKTRRV